ncbi:hypothetical protein SAMN05445060_1568 [Williamsia sterculiae]|uniref:Uncharacterized protein n=1 Tax=Williamsia sterculiae TaxID=1344003 RepID=A0A1N7EQC2_9NOCA|nr:hypothetical protein SAMN05445060_1568 [Williamsia sterculiae]
MSAPVHDRPFLRLAMRCDRVGSAWFVGLGLVVSPVVAVLDVPTGWMYAVWGVIITGAVWLAVLGVIMAVELSLALRSGATLSDEFWSSVLPSLAPAGPVSGRQVPSGHVGAVFGPRRCDVRSSVSYLSEDRRWEHDLHRIPLGEPPDDQRAA